MIWQLIVIAMVGYLIGSVNLSIILSKLMGKGDIREQGSGNAGTTNTLRVLGKGPAALVLIFDICKAVIAILLAKGIFAISGVEMFTALGDTTTLNVTYELGILLAALGAILGHNYPIYYGFKGGKGIATSLGALLMIEWQIGLVCLVFALVLMISSRMVSLGSICAAILYPVLVWIMGSAFGTSFKARMIYTIFAVLVAALAIYRHRANITRLLNGTENKLWKTKAEKLAEISKNSEETK
jgi:acyl phosphate:glycerol-3-phosphate acyltransferase